MLKTSICILISAFLFGCGDVGGGGYPTEKPSINPTGGPITPTDRPVTTTDTPITYTVPTSTPSPLQCNGKKVGTYAWNQDYWRFGNDSTLLDFLSSDLGREWACADLTINVADYSNPDQIHNSGGIITFIQAYRARVRNYDSVVWCSYGDVVEKSAEKLLLFTRTFFTFLASIPADVADSLGTVGISFDVEHFDPEATKDALVLSQQLRDQTNFRNGKILIQHTIEGAPNVVGTEYVMRYADSALAMVYRNYMHDPTGKYQDDSNILNRLMWMLTEQCVHCLDDAYSAQNYKAKITVMVEAACKMGAGCGKTSMCAFDGADQGALYMSTILDELDAALVAGNHITAAQDVRLFDANTRFTSHHWEWYRCFAPFSSSFQYAFCDSYHTYAASCRNQ